MAGQPPFKVIREGDTIVHHALCLPQQDEYVVDGRTLVIAEGEYRIPRTGDWFVSYDGSKAVYCSHDSWLARETKIMRYILRDITAVPPVMRRSLFETRLDARFSALENSIRELATATADLHYSRIRFGVGETYEARVVELQANVDSQLASLKRLLLTQHSRLNPSREP